MIKKILIGFTVMVLTTVAAWHVNVGSRYTDLSDVSLSNLEALSTPEIPNELCNSSWCIDSPGQVCTLTSELYNLHCANKTRPIIAK